MHAFSFSVSRLCPGLLCCMARVLIVGFVPHLAWLQFRALFHNVGCTSPSCTRALCVACLNVLCRMLWQCFRVVRSLWLHGCGWTCCAIPAIVLLLPQAGRGGGLPLRASDSGYGACWLGIKLTRKELVWKALEGKCCPRLLRLRLQRRDQIEVRADEIVPRRLFRWIS